MNAPVLTLREVVDALVSEIQSRRTEWLKESTEPRPKDHPRASDLDPDSCLKRQVLSIVKWDEAEPFSPDLQARFDVGNLLERQGLIELGYLGFRVVKQQLAFELYMRGTKEIAVRGKIDGIVVTEIPGYGRIEIPMEIKSVHPTQYADLNTPADLLDHTWYRKWVHQMQMYLVGHGYEVGFFWLTDCLGRWKAIVVEVDYELAERCWAFAEETLRWRDSWRKDGQLPPQTLDTSECERCAHFKRSCQPEIHYEGVTQWRNGMLEKALEERASVEEAGKEYARIDRKVKGWLKDFEKDEFLSKKDKLLVGDFTIEFTRRRRSGYVVEPTEYREAKIERVRG